MCGITGGVWTDERFAIDAERLERMTTAIAHRGPDATGQFRAPLEPQSATSAASSSGPPPHRGVALGFRRLSIIDLAGGHQPLSNEDGTVWVAFNGEIYNYHDLRAELESSGHQFRSRSDTETIVHLYEEHGVEAFARLNGMFAIAIWDAKRKRLVVARDRLGQKPVVYRHEAGRFAFASELKSLLLAPEVPKQVDESSIELFLAYQYIPAPHTIFEGLHKLPPGNVAIWQPGPSERGELEIRSYWQPDTSLVPIDRANAVAHVRELLTSSVGMRLESEVPLGAFLSGGVDSSIIALLAQRQSEAPVQTFSIGFPVNRYDETPWARDVARHLGTDHTEMQVTPDALSILPEIAHHFDEPFADSSAIPTWYVSQMTREHVTVALSGDGGDELFAGYRRYDGVWLSALIDRLPPLRRILGARPLATLARRRPARPPGPLPKAFQPTRWCPTAALPRLDRPF